MHAARLAGILMHIYMYYAYAAAYMKRLQRLQQNGERRRWRGVVEQIIRPPQRRLETLASH